MTFMHNDKFTTMCAIYRNNVGKNGHMLKKRQENKHFFYVPVNAYKYTQVGCLCFPVVNSQELSS